MVAKANSQAIKPARLAWQHWNFAGATLLSAFLLFQVQPLVSKCILPWFGGVPAVWTTCMLFFQTVLFGGYLYAHLLQRYLPPAKQAAVHLLLVLAAMALLPIAPGPGWRPVDSDSPIGRILLLLTATVGLPYFVLSATSPLVQVWFSRSCPDRSPYRLYALSNFGSLAALLSYPFLFEPAFAMSRQSWLWSGSFVVYGILCGTCLVCLWRLQSPRPTASEAIAPNDASGSGPSLLQHILWLTLPAAASLMLLATTNHLCQDVAAIPLLWVAPLTLYLLTFIICFDHPRWYLRRMWAAAAVVSTSATLLIGVWLAQHPVSFNVQLAAYLSTLFSLCMVCHGELVRLKPSPRHLTQFYLMIAAGGACGGALVSLLAPLIFSDFYEWQCGLMLSFLIAVAVLLPSSSWRQKNWIRNLAVAAAALSGVCVMLHWQSIREGVVYRVRNFYGMVAVLETRKIDPVTGDVVELGPMLKHGQTIHGRQFADPEKQAWPTTYYGERSGVGQAIRYFGQRGKVRVGAIGLGVGTLAAYAGPQDEYRFYEINPAVLQIANSYFTYLAHCRGRCKVILGDGRLSLEREEPQGFNLLVLDAFSGDAIPTHLLTCEAFAVYQRHLAPGGVIAVHISNNYLDLAPVVRGLARHYGLKAIHIGSKAEAADKDRLCESAVWMLLTGNEDFVQAVPDASPAAEQIDLSVPLWTDQYSNLFQILRSGKKSEF